MIILGIDPGTATIGYGVVRKYKTKKGFKALGYGLIKTSSDLPDAERLRRINNRLSKVIKKHKPNILAVEKIFFFRNSKTAFSVSQAKGVILLTAAKKRVPVYEFTPLEMKLVVAGYGRASKEEVQKKIKKHLKLKEIPKPNDAADALGIAICGGKKALSE